MGRSAHGGSNSPNSRRSMTQNSPLDSLTVSFILDGKSAEKFIPRIVPLFVFAVVLVFEFFGEQR